MDAKHTLTQALRGYKAKSTLFDMDGVLCHDFEDVEPGLQPYESLSPNDPYSRHLCNSEPLHVPKVAILGIVTGRLSRYRSQTRQWLAQHNVQLILGLWMSPLWKRQKELWENNSSAQMKGFVYVQHEEADLFIESKIEHAKVIASTACKPVLCTEDYVIYEP